MTEINKSALIEYLNEQSNINEVFHGDSVDFVSAKCGIAKPIGRNQTEHIRELGYVVGDIQTDLVGSKHNPTRVLRVWFYPHDSDGL